MDCVRCAKAWKRRFESEFELPISPRGSRWHELPRLACPVRVLHTSQNTARVQVHSAIQCRLSAERYQCAIGAFAFDSLSHRILREQASLAVYLFDELARRRQQVGTRREAFARLHCGNVRVDERGLDARLVQRL